MFLRIPNMFFSTVDKADKKGSPVPLPYLQVQPVPRDSPVLSLRLSYIMNRKALFMISSSVQVSQASLHTFATLSLYHNIV
jgi:hypothetical protein